MQDANNGASFEAQIFIDSSYEGDLMAQAGVSFTWGRESTAQYSESLAGVRRGRTEGRTMVALAHGASGIGKSAMVNRFR